jgi:hypothetical protein
MPKPMLDTYRQTAADPAFGLASKQDPMEKLSRQDKLRLDRLLRKSRSKGYIESVKTLDAGGHAHNQRQADDIVDAIRQEFPEIEISDILLGIVSKCYLGAPYEVHCLDLAGNIIKHYEQGKPMPGGLEKARSIAIRGGYEFIEVYVECCRAVNANGTVSVI